MVGSRRLSSAGAGSCGDLSMRQDGNKSERYPQKKAPATMMPTKKSDSVTIFPAIRDHICKNCGGEIKNGVCTLCNWHVQCCVCGKQRDENGIWKNPDQKIPEKNISHSFCPECQGFEWQRMKVFFDTVRKR